MKRCIGIVGVIVVLIFSCLYIYGRSDFLYYFYRAEYSTDLDEQIKWYTLAIENWRDYVGFNNLAIAYNNRGYAYSRKGEYDLAIKDYTKAIELDTKDEYAVGNIGEIYFYKGRLDDALKQLDKALSMKEESRYFPFAFWVKVLIYKEKNLKQFLDETVSKAEEYINRQIEKYPKESLYYSSLAEIYCDAGVKADVALSLAKKAVELKPDYANYYVLARAYLLMGNVQSAVENFNQSLNLNPNNVWCLYWLGKVYKYRIKDKVKSEEYFRRGLKVNPKFRFILDELSK